VSKVYGPTGDLSSQVAKLKESDKIQNHRLGDLERDVSSIKRGGKTSSHYDGGTDLAAHTTYVARPGDTLWSIATKHRVSVGEIQQINRMGDEDVRVGQALLIPSPHRLSSPVVAQASYKPSTPGSSPTGATVSTTTTAPLYHTVKKGDSLKAIALKHKTTAAALASANKLKDANKIVVGQRLKIPGRVTTLVSSKRPAPTPSTHDSSDTVPLPGFGMNNAAPPPPAAGLTAAPAPMPPAQPKPSAPVNDSHRGILAYRVDRTDTIETIAQQFSTTPQQICEMNRLDAGTQLKTGDEIMVPAMGAVSVSGR
jgi:LysM repeat protein